MGEDMGSVARPVVAEWLALMNSLTWPWRVLSRVAVVRSVSDEDTDGVVYVYEEVSMDWDDVRPRPKPVAAVGENLAALSVSELEARIEAFEAEIERVRVELKNKRAHEAAAAALFKS